MSDGSRGPGGPDAPTGPSPGLCASCAHHRVIESRRGSRFHLCEKSREDARFPRYPPLPVLRCAGYLRDDPTGEAPGGD